MTEKNATLKTSIRSCFTSAVAAATISLVAPPSLAGPLDLGDVPLGMASAIDPNVMLLIDNSGSMEQIIWHEGYDPGTTYSSWQYRRSGSWTTVPSSGYLRPSQMQQSSCSRGQKRFRRSNSSSSICVNFPDPLGGGNTRVDGNYVRYLLNTWSSENAFNAAVANGTIPNDYRMSVARHVARELVLNTPGMRFGVSHFNNQQGGRVAAQCGASRSSLVDAINALNAEAWTPLAESLYEVTRYFRGLSSHYNRGSYTSPIQYRCQKNFTVVITDGLPTYDASFPNNDPDDPDQRLPNWDGIDNDGSNPTRESSTEGHALFLDDIAKFAWDIDMRKGGTDAAGVSFDDSAYPQQNMHTYTIGFTTANEMLEDAARYGQGMYLTANNAEQLEEELRRALADIQGMLSSASSAAASSGSVVTGSRVYQARFNSEDWSGQLLAFGIDSDRNSATYGQLLTSGNGPMGALWDGGRQIGAWNTRVMMTNTITGVPLRWNNFDAPQRQAYFGNNASMLEYLRGRNVAGFRERTSLLGDIVHSSPQYVGAPSARHRENLEGAGASASYRSFRDAHAERTPMVYVGSNDGMLHGFDADTGQERLAYVPGVLLDRLQLLADPEYNERHRFFVDGSPTVVDAFVAGAWRTVLVGGLNKGGQGIYALDVTDPGNFSESSASSIFMWEFTDADDADLGFTYSQPAIVRTHGGSWVAVFGNGYNNTINDGNASATGNAVLYVVDLATGELLSKIDTGEGVAQDPTGAGRPNGLATVAPVDVDGDSIVDYIYAGDLFGNMWKFDLSSGNSAQWGVAYKLFEACAGNICSTANRQPITTRPSVIRHPTRGGQVVLFGTGQYLELKDNISDAGGVQSFYAIWDMENITQAGQTQTRPVSRSALVQQSIVHEGTHVFEGAEGATRSASVRVTSAERVNWQQHQGWFIDLVSPHGFEGERQVTHSLVRNGRVMFTTMIPSDSSDPCAPVGSSWLMEMDAASGARLRHSPFDLNHDGMFSTADFVSVDEERMSVSGLQLSGGNAQTPTVMAAGEYELVIVPTSEEPNVLLANPGRFAFGRQSWREIYRDQ